MRGGPLNSGDVAPLVILLAGIVIVAFARVGQIFKPAADPPVGPSPETVARLTRNMRTTLTFCGVNLCFIAVMGLLMHRVPEWLWWSLAVVQVAVLAAFWAFIVRYRRERSRV